MELYRIVRRIYKMRINMVDMFDATVESKKTEIAIKHNEEEITFYQLKNKLEIY